MVSNQGWGMPGYSYAGNHPLLLPCLVCIVLPIPFSHHVEVSICTTGMDVTPTPCHTPTYIAHNNLRKLTFASFFSTDAFSFSCPCPTLIDLLQVRKRLGHPIHISPSCCPYTQYLDNLQNSPLLFVGFFTSIHHPVHSCVIVLVDRR